MAATTRLGLNAQTPGTNAFTWGSVLNTQAIDLIDEAVAGVEPISLTGNLTLTNTNFVSNQARQMVLIFAPGVGLAAPATITIPARDKLYLFQNKTAFTLTVSCGGATADLAAGRWGFIVCDGTSVFCFDPVAVSENARIGAEVARDLAVKWATLTGGNVDGSEFSSKEYAVGITAPLGSSKSWATKTGSAVAGSDYSARENASGTTVPTGSALQWATKTGSAVASAEFSAKEYAQGTPTLGSARSWSITLGSAVAGGEYAAKEYAIGDLTATGGSAKAWAVDASSPNGTTDKSAKSLASDAAGSATLAQQWAANPENVVVTGGAFSALHYAAKAAASAAAAATFDPSSYYSKTAADARYVPQAGNVSLTGNIYDTIVDKGTVSSGTVTFDVSLGAVQRLQVGGALTIALSGKPATRWELEIELVNGGVGTITWPTAGWIKGDGAVSSSFADMGVALQTSGTNTVILWGTGTGAVRGRAG